MNLASRVQGQHSLASLTLEDGSQQKEPCFGAEANDVATWFRDMIVGADGVRSSQ